MPPKKGQKGKKKLCRPEVTRFLQTHQYKCMRSLLDLPGGVPSVHQPSIDTETENSIAALLSVLGRIGISMKYTPAGYPPDVVRHARTILTRNSMVFVSGRGLTLDGEDLQGAANQFLMDVDFHVNGIVAWIEKGLSCDFASTGLVAFQGDLRERFQVFDYVWAAFEERVCHEIGKVMKEIFKPIDLIVDLEGKLSVLEDAQEYEAKRDTEQQLVAAITELLRILSINEDGFKIPKLPASVVAKAKKLIRQYLKLRLVIREIPVVRLKPDLHTNGKLVRAVEHFYWSARDCVDGFDLARCLPILPCTRPVWLLRMGISFPFFQQAGMLSEEREPFTEIET
uniref:GH22156, related n=1 Tax=Neospora caninum (strain Liverpool) TaxID=572307 RepID=A0A0F7UFH2_NEOCL|nr:TPA: GH22156, related [Neospora caninum Liverpool]